MKFPKKRPQAAKELRVPDLAGGLNLRDGLSEVLDNQLTDSVNMWWKDGVLKTRPGISTSKDMITYVGRPADQTAEVRFFPEIKRNINNKLYVLRVTKISQDMYDGTYQHIFLFNWQGEKEIINLPLFGLKTETAYINYFVVEKNGCLYCFTANLKIHKLLDDDDVWTEVLDEEYYVPLVYAHCSAVIFSGTQFEGFNLIGNKFKMKYSTVNPNILPVTAGDGSGNVSIVYLHEMTYPFPDGMITNPEEYIGKEVKAIITDEYGKKTVYSAVFKELVERNGEIIAEGWGEMSENGWIMFISTKGIDFRIDNIGLGNVNTADPLKIPADAVYIEDNLEIIMPYVPTIEEKAKVFNMTHCEWFGGSSEGLDGGTRLFLCGNSSEKEKALVVWSGLNNLLYFPKNSYFYVGNKADAVTGFGKQSDMLVVFKENETWYTKYSQNTNITAKDTINQSVIDYTSSSVYFLLVQINPNIGCRYPDTVQLCRNRLVWLGDNGNIYTLVNESQYNERSIFCVSEMVKRRLKDEIAVNVTACDWNGYYCLSIGNRMYIFDYNCYGYSHIAGYSKSEDANVRIPWYYWELPINGAITTIDTAMVIAGYYNALTYGKCSVISCSLSENNGQTDNVVIDEENNNEFVINQSIINSSIQTKLFDFAMPHIRKNVDRLDLQLGCNEGAAIRVEFITESGTEEQEIVIDGTDTRSYSAGHIENKALFPCIRQTLKFGVRLSSKGTLVIDGMVLKYRGTGGAR